MGLFDHLRSALFRSALASLLVGPMLIGAAQAGPNLVTNGDFSSCNTNGGVCSQSQLVSGSNLYGWTTTSSYSFLQIPTSAGTSGTTATVNMNQAGGSSGITVASFPGLSPDGGNFLLQDSAYEVGTLSQTLSNLVIGQSYSVGFYQAAAQQSGYTGQTTDYWQVSLGSQTLNSTLMTDASQSYVGWMPQLLTFVANATSEVLGFMAVGTPAGQPPFAALDGVSVTAVPEPASFALLGGALVGLGIIRRRRSTRAE